MNLSEHFLIRVIPHAYRAVTMKRARFYSAAHIPDDYKTKLARLYIAQRDGGKSNTEFVQNLRAAGTDLSERTLDRWALRYTLTGSVVSSEKLTGAAALLTRAQRDVLSGWVLHQIATGSAVHLETYCGFSNDYFGVTLTTRTASRYLADDGFTYRTLQKKTKSFVINVDKLRIDAWKWVETQQFPGDYSKIASIDFTFTGHRTERRSGFGIKGGQQPMEATHISTYTNCIVTLIWADGINRTPPMLFTFNPTFRRDRNPTKQRVEQVAYLDERLKHYGIAPDRVVYVGKDKYEKEHYVKESPAILRRFFKKYEVSERVSDDLQRQWQLVFREWRECFGTTWLPKAYMLPCQRSSIPVAERQSLARDSQAIVADQRRRLLGRRGQLLETSPVFG